MNTQLDIFSKPKDATFYNTVNLKGDDLKKAKENNLSKEDRILDIFRRYGCPLTPMEVSRIYDKMYPAILLTSVRRTITDLTKKRGELLKLDSKKEGGFGCLNYTWIYNKNKVR